MSSAPRCVCSKRPVLCLRFVTAQLDMLEQMSPWEYQEIRKVLGHGSGFDSPGFRELRRQLIRLGEAFHRLRRAEGLLRDLCARPRPRDLYQLAEALVELDEWTQTWRVRHYRVVARVIGDKVIGTQGHAGRGARATDPQGLLSGALGGPERADRALEVRG